MTDRPNEGAVEEAAPAGPRFEERTIPVCPVCHNLVRRDLNDPAAGREHGPWRCDLHGQVEVVWETWEVPTYDNLDGGAYELNDPKHPTYHERMVDYADLDRVD